MAALAWLMDLAGCPGWSAGWSNWHGWPSWLDWLADLPAVFYFDGWLAGLPGWLV
jgi:hypothetical protein